MPSVPTFQDEDELQEVLAELFRKMQRFEVVRVNQGAQEFGKDILLVERDELLGERWWACVVKNEPIRGSVGRASSARTVLQQIQQAFDTNYWDLDGRKVRVEQVLVVTPFTVQASTMSAIEGQLNAQLRPGVRLVDADLPFSWFSKYWPDRLMQGGVYMYLQSLGIRLDEADPLAAVAGIYGQVVGQVGRRDSAYVVPRFERRLFGVGPGSKRILVPPERANSYWKYEVIRSHTYELASAEAFARHCSSWNLCEAESGELAHLAERAASMCRDLGDYKAQAASRTLAKKERFRARAMVHSLIAELDDAIPAASDGLIRLVASLTAAAQGCGNPERFVRIAKAKLLRDQRFIKLATLCDSMDLAPPGFMQIGSPIDIGISARALLTSGASVLIVGPPGGGKSTFCRESAKADALAHKEDANQPIPVFLPLQLVASKRHADFGTLLRSALDISLLATQHPGGINALLRKGHLRLYLDGLDEIPDKAWQRQVVELMESATGANPRLQVVLTARTYVVGAWLALLPRIQLSKLTHEQVAQIAEQLLRDPAKADTFMRTLKSESGLSGMAANPLLATLAVLVFRQTGRLPAERSRLYEVFVDLQLQGWDLAKGIQRGRQYPAYVKRRVLEHLAWTLHWQLRRDFSIEELEDGLGRYIELVPESAEDVARELVEDGLLFRTALGLSFSHLSYQEYLCATYAAQDSNRIARVVRAVGDTVWWDEVLAFVVAASDPMLFGSVVASCEAEAAVHDKIEVLMSATHPELIIGELLR